MNKNSEEEYLTQVRTAMVFLRLYPRVAQEKPRNGMKLSPTCGEKPYALGNWSCSIGNGDSLPDQHLK